VSRLTLRGRVMVAAIGILAAALAGLSIGFNLLLDHQLDSDASTVLRNRAAAQMATIDVSGRGVRVEESPNDAALDQQAWVFAGRRVLEQPAATPAAVRSAVAGLVGGSRRQERSAGGDARLLAVPLRDSGGRLRGTVVVGVSLVPYRHTRRIALVGSAILSALLLLAALIAVRWGVRSALRPVADMTRRAADWSEHDLHRRFDLGPPRDELTALAATFDGLLRRIEAVLRHEQRFSAEMAHELRTPLTGMAGEAELGLARGTPDEEVRASFERILDSTRRMQTVIDTLLSSARAAEGEPPGACDPLPPVREAMAAVAGPAASKDVDVRLVAPREPILVDAAPAMVSQALYPLLENGVRHASSRVEVSLSWADGEATVAVSDDGPGLPDSDVFEPGISTTGGAGLGLPLARRLARSCGGDVAAVSSPVGSRFELRLPGGARSG
jgi:signal transduction histidine kinase